MIEEFVVSSSEKNLLFRRKGQSVGGLLMLSNHKQQCEWGATARGEDSQHYLKRQAAENMSGAST